MYKHSHANRSCFFASCVSGPIPSVSPSCLSKPLSPSIFVLYLSLWPSFSLSLSLSLSPFHSIPVSTSSSSSPHTALMMKRWHFSKRDERALCCSLVIPLVVLVLGLGLLQLPSSFYYPPIVMGAAGMCESMREGLRL